MNKNSLSVRPLENGDIDSIIQYWLGCDDLFLQGMGVDKTKLPGKFEWRNMLTEQLNTPIEKKKSYCIIWQSDNKAIGHSNVTKIIFGEEAYMHLHMWDTNTRAKGLGTSLVKMTLPYFFKNLKLKKLYCEPYALNPSPNKTLEKVGFELVKNYVTIPNPINFEQSVNRWLLSVDKFKTQEKDS